MGGRLALRLEPVSYTHLDVYKRQEQDDAVKDDDDDDCITLLEICLVISSNNVTSCGIIVPSSETYIRHKRLSNIKIN